MTHWIFANSCLAPQVVYIAVGTNDCRRGADGDDVAEFIIQIIESIKYFSPGTHVVVQSILPSADDDDDWEGEDWDDMDAHDCVEEANEEVKDYIDKKLDDECVEFLDLKDFILDSGGEFRDDIFDDGLHFWKGGEYKKYAEKIADSISDADNADVNARASSLDWVDVEPMYYRSIEGDTMYRWRYNEWSNCTGPCGMQRRTAECHHIPNANATNSSYVIGYTVPDEYCAKVYMNPLQRVCNIDDVCLAEMGVPPGSLVFTPNSAIAGSMASEVDEPCDTEGWDTRSMALLGCVIALAVGLLVACGVVIFMVRQQEASKASSAAAIAQQKLGGLDDEIERSVSGAIPAGASI
eukprot:scaffold91339_cov40-Prasinocladus_malaysianus.AAC.1